MPLLAWAEANSRARLADALPQRWIHVQKVAERAAVFACALGTDDGEVLHAAAWLHDVGYAPDLAVTGFHPLDGACFLAKEGLRRLAGLVAFHSAAAAEAKSLGLGDELGAFEDERSLVRDLLWFSDMTTGPSGEAMSFERRMAEVKERYPHDHYVVRALDDSMVERRAAVARAEEWIERSGLAAHV